MPRYVLFDSECSACSGIADELAKVSDGKLEARSLHHPGVQRHLDANKPGWRWEPMLLEGEGEEFRVYSGVAFRARIVRLVGIRRSWQIAQLVARHETSTSSSPLNRRRFIERSAVLGAAAVALGLFPSASKTVGAAPARQANEPGPAAQGQGIYSYLLADTADGLSIDFEQSGIPSRLVLSHLGGGSAAFTLYRSDVLQLSGVWDASSPALSLTTAAGSSTTVTPDYPAEADPVASQYYSDIQTIMAVYLDFEPADAGTVIESPASREDVAEAEAEMAAAAGFFCPCALSRGRTWRVNGGSRSSTCQKNINAANRTCMNQFCTGCCLFQPPNCACACIAGDFGCYCSTTAYPCNGPCRHD